ncbi:MAG: transposase [Planctomycetota bacterium]|nr:MAG: transposase [Planctomycetota bacterium]
MSSPPTRAPRRKPPKKRRSTRLKGFDYAQEGAYFVTICSFQRDCNFGEVIEAEMRPNDYGRIVEATWAEIPEHHPTTILDEFIVMPNHIHAVMFIVGATPASPVATSPTPGTPIPVVPGPKRGSLGAIIGSFKASVTRKINRLRQSPGMPVWQRNYYDHVIRSERELLRIRTYIQENPLRWSLDPENPQNVKKP